MKKKLLGLFGIALLAFSLAGCGQPAAGGDEGGTVIVTKYNVGFEVDGTRIKTLRIEAGQKITETIADPVKEGFRFTGWYEGTTLVDLSTYVVSKNVVLTAGWEEEHETNPYDNLSVDDVKVAGQEYYLVLGWWEVNDPAQPTKRTSYLTPTRVRMFYYNLINYLKARGATDANIKNISFRNYASDTVAHMGEAINADGDVDLMVGVGKNINTDGGVSLYNNDNNYKFDTEMSAKDDGTAVNRYVALLSTADEFAKSVYEWLDTATGRKSFLQVLTDEEIQASLDVKINLTVTIHGDTDVVTTVTDRDAKLNLATITPPEGYHFVGYATSQDGEVVLNKAADAEISYNDIKTLVAEGATTLDLYPVFEKDEVATEDLVVFIQTNNITEPEAALLQARYLDKLTEKKNIRFKTINGDAATFTDALDATVDVVIGGNSPLKNFVAHADGPLSNAGAKHFANTSRKVLIRDTVSAEHLDLAKDFYNFVVAEATQFEVHVTYWTKNNDWITADELAAIKLGVEANLKTYLNTEDLAASYNVVITSYEATNTKVADLGAETKALRDGKGTDLIVGCGTNVTTTGGIETVAMKAIPTSIVAAGRQVAIIRDNGLVRNIYDVYFAEPVIAE